MRQGIPGYLRYRVVDRIANAEITSDLPHLHQSDWEIAAMLPGNPGAQARGSFRIPLHPPGTPGYKKAKATYDKLDDYQRVEAYLGYSARGIGLGKFKFGGIIRRRHKKRSPGLFELEGESDLVLANYSQPFPGELFPSDVTSEVLKGYLGTNEFGFGDTFNPFTAGNYTSTNLPSNSSGAWSGTTDDGFPVVSVASGTGAVLISKTGAAANDRWRSHYVEVRGRLNPTADTSNAGRFGIGISKSTLNVNDSVVAEITSRVSNGRRNFDVALVVYAAGVATIAFTLPNQLIEVDDPTGNCPFVLGLLVTTGGNSGGTESASIILNGQVIVKTYTGIGYNAGTGNNFPFLMFTQASSGTATGYFRNLTHFTRFTPDGPSAASVFGIGTITAATSKLQYGTPPPGSFLETWAALQKRDGWYLRYTPQPFVLNTRTLGLIDFAVDPGSDLTSKVAFKARSNLIDLELTGNSDVFGSGTGLLGAVGPDGAGIAFERDIATMLKYGVIEDLTSGLTAQDFASLSRAAYSVMQNKILTGTAASKTATVLRDKDTMDRWRELDRVLVHEPEMGVFNQTARIVGYNFAEGLAHQVATLDQFADQ